MARGTMARIGLACLALLAAAWAGAHETRTVGDGDEQYQLIVGYATEPAYTEERNGLSLTVRTPDEEPVPNLANGLTATLESPQGATRELELRAVHGNPGAYTDDFVLSRPGTYRLHLQGFVGGVEVDESFDLHEVAPFEALRFP